MRTIDQLEKEFENLYDLTLTLPFDKVWWFISCREDLEEIAQFNPDIINYIYKKLNKKQWITKSTIPMLLFIKAKNVSLYNCRTDIKKTKTGETRLSRFIYPRDKAYNILLKYKEWMHNPLAYLCDRENYAKYKSLFYWRFNIVKSEIKKNWKWTNIPKFFYASETYVSPIDIIDIWTQLYHPFIWYLLENDLLINALDYETSYVQWKRKTKKKQNIS